MLAGGCWAESAPAERVKLRVGSVDVSAEVADDAAEREKGLMFRRVLGADEGMWFVWPDSGRRVFWMKNTYVPLDMIFVKGGKVVAVIADAKPLDETPLDPGVDSSEVLEMKAGWASSHGVSVGTPVGVMR